ncbi:YfiT family bacillithiol transferase [Zunongwangia endophytica]|uniref:YfiT family bacillithiol transferase n=1 Tax=Zunongwangia endophytica TaxID=1808945 RepID=A0ABV8H9G6_9FLAO|nr:putative metal-dependent hydrolase [Zunongwangia endophytica]MDN3595092.1 putative metal-dependent hydrolase [Zunongwangia endophytica]
MTLEQLKYPIGTFINPTEITSEQIKIWTKDIADLPSILKNLTGNLSEAELSWQYRPKGWTIKQVIHHLADSHMNSIIRFKIALTEKDPAIRGYDETAWAELDDYSSDIHQSLILLEGLHHRWVKLIENFSENELQKTFYHPERNQKYSLKTAIGMYAWHSNHHLAHIEQALFYKGKFE